eukprot:scaffold52237_cov15-Tisochrysis_lutea.AAC.1
MFGPDKAFGTLPAEDKKRCGVAGSLAGQYVRKQLSSAKRPCAVRNGPLTSTLARSHQRPLKPELGTHSCPRRNRETKLMGI